MTENDLIFYSVGCVAVAVDRWHRLVVVAHTTDEFVLLAEAGQPGVRTVRIKTHVSSAEHSRRARERNPGEAAKRSRAWRDKQKALGLNPNERRRKATATT